MLPWLEKTLKLYCATLIEIIIQKSAPGHELTIKWCGLGRKCPFGQLGFSNPNSWKLSLHFFWSVCYRLRQTVLNWVVYWLVLQKHLLLQLPIGNCFCTFSGAVREFITTFWLCFNSDVPDIHYYVYQGEINPSQLLYCKTKPTQHGTLFA